MINDNNLTKKEMEQLVKTLEIKRDILSYLNIEKFITEVSKIVEESQLFDFRSITAKMFIDKKQPVFILKALDEELLSKTVEEVNNVLISEIISKISVLLTDCLFNNKDNVEIFEGVPEEMKEFIISSIYVIRSNLKENNIQLFFFM